MKAPTFGQAVAFEHSARGAYSDLKYTPTFRAAGIFFAFADAKTDTHVSFLNYWREKNGNPSVSALVTIRDDKGAKVWREFTPLQDFTYQLGLKKALGAETFTGSIEVELHSPVDLKYAFPAIEVFYETPDGVSFVHSNQRVFNGVEDMDKNSALNARQTGFDVWADGKMSGFFSVVNGPRRVPDAKARVELFNAAGRRLELVFELGDLPAYGSRLLDIGARSEARDFLGEKPGFCKVDVDAFGVFTRLACGNRAVDGSRLSVTHSYYDCNSHDDYFEASGSGELDCFLPFNLVEGLDLDLVFYPIYSKSRLRFSLDAYDKDGRLAKTLDDVAALNSTGTEMVRLDVRALLAKSAVRDAKFLCLRVDSEDGRIPARLTFGMNYRREGVGANINNSVFMGKSYGLRRRVYLWSPLMARAGSENWILLSHFSKKPGAVEQAELTLSVFTKSKRVLVKTFPTHNAEALNVSASRLLSEAGYAPAQNEILWYTVESNNPNLTCNTVHASAKGFIGADHSF
ncbi:MAG: hypothetical protein ACHQ2Z_00875 [Elusimicrobiota bacterium]